MKLRIEDSKKLVELCKDMRHDEVIECVMYNEEVVNYIQKITDDKDQYTQVMHDTILSLIRSCMKEGFSFDKNPIAYIKSIAKYINIKLSKAKIKNHTIDISTMKEIPLMYEVNYDIKEILGRLLGNISIDCKEILELWAMKYRMTEISKRLSYNSENYAKKKKHLCLKKLIVLVDRDPKLKEELRLYV